jgi:hypothetical protein
MRPADVTVHIERLVIHRDPGAAPHGELVGAAVRAGLERLLVSGWTPAEKRSREAAGDGPDAASAGGDTAALGDVIARAVHERMGSVAELAALRPAGEGAGS